MICQVYLFIFFYFIENLHKNKQGEDRIKTAKNEMKVLVRKKNYNFILFKVII